MCTACVELRGTSLNCDNVSITYNRLTFGAEEFFGMGNRSFCSRIPSDDEIILCRSKLGGQITIDTDA